jgi:hypothetical protein
MYQHTGGHEIATQRFACDHNAPEQLDFLRRDGIPHRFQGAAPQRTRDPSRFGKFCLGGVAKRPRHLLEQA